MKVYEFNIHVGFLDTFFIPIRNKVSIIKLLMDSVRYMLLNPDVPNSQVGGKLLLQVDKMSRIFFISPKKIFSISLPFFVEEENGRYSFKYLNAIDVEHELTSKVLEMISCDEFSDGCSLDFFDSVSEVENQNENFWELLKGLLLMEDGYVRYDYDKENYDKHKRIGKEHHHPLNHYDVFYSTSATFKIGVVDKLSYKDFLDTLDTTTECKYLKGYSS